MPAAQPKPKPHHPSPSTPPEHFGPTEAEIGKLQKVPPHPTLSYTLGITARQQTRILTVGVVAWVMILLLLFSAYLF